MNDFEELVEAVVRCSSTMTGGLLATSSTWRWCWLRHRRASSRARHQALAGQVSGVPVRVALLGPRP